MTEQPHNAPSAKQVNKAPVIAILRIAGAFFIVAGIAAFLDAGGFASSIFGFDPMMCKIFGGMLMMVGATDFFILPRILGGKGADSSGDKAL